MGVLPHPWPTGRHPKECHHNDIWPKLIPSHAFWPKNWSSSIQRFMDQVLLVSISPLCILIMSSLPVQTKGSNERNFILFLRTRKSMKLLPITLSASPVLLLPNSLVVRVTVRAFDRYRAESAPFLYTQNKPFRYLTCTINYYLWCVPICSEIFQPLVELLKRMAQVLHDSRS